MQQVNAYRLRFINSWRILSASRKGESVTLGEIIRAGRLRREWVQEDLARAVGVRQVSVSIWETNKGLPEPANVGRLIVLLDLDVTATWLAFGRAVNESLEEI